MKNRIVLLASTLTCLGNAFAEDPAPPSFPDAWKFNLGVGVGSQPKFPGSDQRRTIVLPVLSATCGRYFIGGAPGAGMPAGVGVYLLRESGWTAGVGLGAALRSPRKASDSPRLAGMGDIPKTVEGSFFVNYDRAWWSVHGGLQSDIAGKGEGTTASLDAEFRAPLGHGIVLSAGPGLTWANRTYQQTFFGVTPAQRMVSGLPVDDLKGGVDTVRLDFGAGWKVSPRWSVGARLSLGRLVGEAADSPITQDRRQDAFGLSATYGF